MLIAHLIVVLVCYLLTGFAASALGVRRYEALIALGFLVSGLALVGVGKAFGSDVLLPWQAVLIAAIAGLLAIFPHVVFSVLSQKKSPLHQRVPAGVHFHAVPAAGNHLQRLS